MEKLFLVEIDSLDNEKGCFASNKHFSEFFGLSKGRCTQIIKGLEKKNLITITYEREGRQITKRIIRVVNKLNNPVNKLNKGSKKTKQGYLENDGESNTSNSNTSNSNNSRNSKEYGDDSPYMDLAKRLFEHIKKRNPKQKEPNWQTWADDFRKTVELDDRELDEVIKVLDWCQQDDFWRNNVLSPSKFRKQYDQLYLKMKDNTGYGGESYGGLEY